MAEIPCTILEIDLESETSGRMIPGVVATCSRCQHETESFGTSDDSIRRCLALMRQECPRGQRNFYVEDEG